MKVNRHTLAILAGLLLLLLAQAAPALADTPGDSATVGLHVATFGVVEPVDPTIGGVKLSDIVVSSDPSLAGDGLEAKARRIPWKEQCWSCHGYVSPSPSPEPTSVDSATVGTHVAASGVVEPIDPTIAGVKLSDIVVSSDPSAMGGGLDARARRLPWKERCWSCHGYVSPSPSPEPTNTPS